MRADPDFVQLVGPYLQRFPEASRPALLAALERVAAARYRGWAEQARERAPGLRTCAAREEEIAGIADSLFPSDGAVREQIQALLPEALLRCATLEEASALFLDGLVAEEGGR